MDLCCDFSSLIELNEDIKSVGLSSYDLEDVLIPELRTELLQNLQPMFVRYINNITNLSNISDRVELFVKVCEQIVEICEGVTIQLGLQINDPLFNSICQLIFNSLFTERNLSVLSSIVTDYLKLTFQHFFHQQAIEKDVVKRMETFLRFSPLKRLSSKIFYKLLKEFLLEQYLELVSHLFQRSTEENIMKFLQHHRSMYLSPFLSHLFEENITMSLDEAFLENLATESYYVCCEKELFDLVRDYPESRRQLVPLRYCISHLHRRPAAMEALGRQLEQRLLHPGVSTGNILEIYVNAVGCFLLLDPSGKMLEVLSLVAAYLRDRGDTVRCILDILLRDDENVFRDNLTASNMEELVLEDKNEGVGAAINEYLDWNPEPIDNMYFFQQWGESCDLLSQLVNIFGNKNRFIKQFKSILAQRILSRSGFETYSDLKHLEMLKTRFGDEKLHECQVMIQDIHASKRICSLIKENALKEGNIQLSDIEMTAFILSDQFWPPMKEDKMNIPQHWMECFDEFKGNYERMKGNRTLIWQPHLGVVNLEVQLPNSSATISVDVSPIMAVALHHFTEKEAWDVRELSATMDVTPSVCRRACQSWEERGVLYRSGEDSYSLRVGKEEEEASSPNETINKTSHDYAHSSKCVDAGDTREDSHMDTVSMVMHSDLEQKAQQEALFMSYIRNMLINRGEMSLAQIHSVLRMFASASMGLSECSEKDIRRFLESKVRDGTLLVNGDKYRINPSNQ